MRRIAAFAAALALALALAVCGGTDPSFLPGAVILPDGSAGADTEAVFRDAAAALDSVGLTDAGSGAVETAVDEFAGADTEGWLTTRQEAAAILLFYAGMGEYDEDTCAWSPTSSQVYAFDAECYDLEHMYTLCLQGVASLVGSDASFSQIEEDLSQVNWDEGTGTQTIRFTCGGEACSYDAAVNNDWFDTGFLDYLGSVLKKTGCEKKLLVTDDGYQTVIVFYNTDDWADDYRDAVGGTLTAAGSRLSLLSCSGGAQFRAMAA